MTNLERYLRLATWGLMGTHRKTVRLGLEAHVRHKAWKYQLQGLNEPEAIIKALEDLGPPHVVSAGMNQVYTMPNILRNTLLCAVLATLGVSNLTGSMAQVVATTRLPIRECANGQNSFIAAATSWPCEQPRLWLSLSSLRTTLEPKGVKFNQAPGFPPGTTMTFMRFPGTDVDITLQPDGEVTFRNSSGRDQSFITQPDYFSMFDLVGALSYAPVPVTLSGWNNPEIIVGQTRFTLGTQEKIVRGEDYYDAAISRQRLETAFPSIAPNRNVNDLEDALLPLTTSGTFVGNVNNFVPYNHRITIKGAQRDDVFVVLSREGPSKAFVNQEIQSVRRVNILPADSNGSFQYVSASKRLTVSSNTNLPRGVIDGDGTIALLRFSGRIDRAAPDPLTTVAPADVTVTPAR